MPPRKVVYAFEDGGIESGVEGLCAGYAEVTVSLVRLVMDAELSPMERLKTDRFLGVAVTSSMKIGSSSSLTGSSFCDGKRLSSGLKALV